jgi:hypothetical protein
VEQVQVVGSLGRYLPGGEVALECRKQRLDAAARMDERSKRSLY